MSKDSNNPILEDIQKIFADKSEVPIETLDPKFGIIRIAGIDKLMYVMIKEELINPERENEWMYLWTLLLKHLMEILDKMEYVLDISQELLSDAKRSIKDSKYYSAIILISTVAEHLINTCYRHILPDKCLSQNQIDDVLKISFRSKLDWLKDLVGLDIPKRLTDKLMFIYKMRNLLVHYESELKTINQHESTFDQKMSKIEQIDYEQLLEDIDEFRDEIQKQIGVSSKDKKKAIELREFMIVIPEEIS